MKILTLAATLLLSVVTALSQKTKTAEATYIYYGQENETIAQVKQKALERARLQAIEDAFGSVVMQSNSTVITNENGKTDSKFYSVGGSEVKGEWIETIGQPKFEIEYKDHIIVAKCTVRGKIREITEARTPLEVRILRNGTELRDETDDFREGDDMFLYFKTPVEGSLLVFMLDGEDNAYCLLPYARCAEPARKVYKDIPYVFFSSEMEADIQPGLVDEYTLTCNGAVEQNEIVTVFAPGNLVRPNMTFADESVPGMLPAAEFRKWLADVKKHDNKIQSISNIITIKKSQR